MLQRASHRQNHLKVNLRGAAELVFGADSAGSFAEMYYSEMTLTD